MKLISKGFTVFLSVFYQYLEGKVWYDEAKKRYCRGV